MIENNKFIQKFSKKTKSELLEIIQSNKHIDKAKIAANYNLQNKNYKTYKPNQQRKTTKINNKTSIKSELKMFFKSLSYREFLSIFSSVLLLISLIFLRDFYARYAFFEATYNVAISIIIFTTILISNHVFYKLEHGRSNSFYGRLLMDLTFIFIYTIACIFLEYKEHFDLQELMIFIILLIMLELFISFIKKYLKIF